MWGLQCRDQEDERGPARETEHMHLGRWEGNQPSEEIVPRRRD